MQRKHVRDSKGMSKEVYVGRRTETRAGHILSNPFRPAIWNNVGASQECVEKYRRWLWQRIKDQNKPILKALAELSPDSVLLCHCHTNKPCHADIIIKAWLYCWEKGIIPPPVSAWHAPDRSKARTADALFLLSSKPGLSVKVPA